MNLVLNAHLIIRTTTLPALNVEVRLADLDVTRVLQTLTASGADMTGS